MAESARSVENRYYKTRHWVKSEGAELEGDDAAAKRVDGSRGSAPSTLAVKYQE